MGGNLARILKSIGQKALLPLPGATYLVAGAFVAASLFIVLSATRKTTD